MIHRPNRMNDIFCWQVAAGRDASLAGGAPHAGPHLWHHATGLQQRGTRGAVDCPYHEEIGRSTRWHSSARCFQGPSEVGLPSTPPPPSMRSLAALTMASPVNRVRSPLCSTSTVRGLRTVSQENQGPSAVKTDTSGFFASVAAHQSAQVLLPLA